MLNIGEVNRKGEAPKKEVGRGAVRHPAPAPGHPDRRNEGDQDRLREALRHHQPGRQGALRGLHPDGEGGGLRRLPVGGDRAPRVAGAPVGRPARDDRQAAQRASRATFPRGAGTAARSSPAPTPCRRRSNGTSRTSKPCSPAFPSPSRRPPRRRRRRRPRKPGFPSTRRKSPGEPAPTAAARSSGRKGASNAGRAAGRSADARGTGPRGTYVKRGTYFDLVGDGGGVCPPFHVCPPPNSTLESFDSLNAYPWPFPHL